MTGVQTCALPIYEKTRSWKQAYDTNGNKAITQTDCNLEVTLDGGATWQRAFDDNGNNLVSAEVIDALDQTTEWRWVPAASGAAAEASGSFKFNLEPFHNYKVVCRDTKNRVLKPSVMNWEDSPLTRPTKNAEDQTLDADGKPKDQVAAMWDNDLWLKGGVAETNSFYAEVPTDASGRALYEDPKNTWKGYKIYDKLALGWIDGTKGFLGNYVWSDKNDGTETSGLFYDGLQGDVPNVGVGQVEVTLEQYYWLPDDAKTDDPANYDPGTPGKDGTGQGRWVLNDLE